ncbi:MAG: glycoside hydrolase family 13 protein [Tindallia sp. MSAO_Bac2]|nr:MAG: glycoside hydrolase family 13 protein [Tindallia sp. MSAO_Bac2]
MIKSILFHDSHQEAYRSPFGAVPCSRQIRIGLSGDLLPLARSVYLRVWRDHQGESLLEMKPKDDRDDFYHATLTSDSTPCLLWYYFIVETADGIYFYGNNKKRQGGCGELSREIPFSYQITIYRQSHIPEWYLNGIMYQIFPDRFFNGLKSGNIRGAKKDSVLHGRWADDPLYIKDPSKGNIMKWDFYGGNLEGIIEKLDYLQDLGVSIIYLNPIFEAASNHRYDTADYMKIDPMLGTEALFRQLCREAEQRGMKIILDGVFSHTGSDSVYFNREGNYSSLGAYQSKNSPYYPWYRFTEHPNDYDCWWGIATMPNTNELEHSFKKFIYEGEDSVTRHWLRQGACGWRLDVADELPSEFIKELKKALKEENENAVLIGEVWEDASNKVSHGEKREYLLGDELDSVMNYPFRSALLEFFLAESNGYETHAALMSLFENYPITHFYSCMNLIGSHDRSRILTRLGEAPDPDSLTETDKMQYRLPKKNRELAVARYKMASLFQMTFPGVPSIYYGDEAGLEGFSDPLNRRTFPWGDEDEEILEWTKAVVRIRNQYEVLRKGDWEAWTIGEHHYGFSRKMKGRDTVLVVFNISFEEISVTEEMNEIGSATATLHDLITDEKNSITDEKVRVKLPPLTGRIFSIKK